MDCSPPGSSVHGILWQEYWSGLPCPPPGGLPHSGMEPASLTSPALLGGFFTTSATWEAPFKDKQLLSALPWPHPRWALLDWNEATAEGAGAH